MDIPQKSIFYFGTWIFTKYTKKNYARVRLLRAELHNLKKRSALKTGSLDRPIIIDSNRSCGRCRSDLGRILNRGAPCRACKLRVCKGCREFTNRTDWVCVVCHKQMWVLIPLFAVCAVNILIVFITRQCFTVITAECFQLLYRNHQLSLIYYCLLWNGFFLLTNVSAMH